MFELQTVRNIGDLNVGVRPTPPAAGRLQRPAQGLPSSAGPPDGRLHQGALQLPAYRLPGETSAALFAANSVVEKRVPDGCLSPPRGHSTEHGALLAAGTGCTGPVFEFFTAKVRKGVQLLEDLYVAAISFSSSSMISWTG